MTTEWLFSLSPFFTMALLASTSASIPSGIIGSYVVVKRIVFISGSIAHSVLGGIGIALYLRETYALAWLKPIYGALLAAILAAAAIGSIRLYYRQREDTVIAALWALGMSVGVIFISLTPSYTPELIDYLFGNILWTSKANLYTLLGLDVLILVITFFFHSRFLAICFDEEQAILQNQPVKSLYFLLLSLIAITVVILIQVVGAILLIAILSLPAAIANTYTKNLPKMMSLATLLSIAVSTLGLTLSWFSNWPSGATIALTITTVYLANLIRRKG
ncbi:MAG: metal ABC transporter permease [Chlamydiota bacterium]